MNLNDINKTAISCISECPTDCRNKIFKVALMLAQSPNQDRTKALEKILADYNLSREQVYNILGICLSLVYFFIQSTDKEFNKKLLELGFSEDFTQSLPLMSNRDEVVGTILNARRTDFTKLVSIKWRIDVSLRDSSLVNKIPPTIIFTFELKNGKKYTVTVDMKVFHKLRFNVALILKELDAVKSNQAIFK